MPTNHDAPYNSISSQTIHFLKLWFKFNPSTRCSLTPSVFFPYCQKLNRMFVHCFIYIYLFIYLFNEKLNDLYSSPNTLRVIKSRRMRWAGHVARMGEERGAYRVLVVKPDGKRPLGKPRRGWVDNIRMDLQEVGCGYVDWIGLAQDRDRWRKLVSAVMNLRVP